MTEADMQNIVAATVQQARDLALVPNCGALGHEADLLRITDRRQVHEIEIKISRSDFLADRRKTKNLKLDKRWADIYARRGRLPHYFWYAVLADVASSEELPDHAGLIVVEGSEAKVLRPAKRIHKEALSDRVFEYALRGQRLRYWQERDGINPLREARERRREIERQYREDLRESRKRRAEAAAAWEETR
jgi:hypothetical protein